MTDGTSMGATSSLFASLSDAAHKSLESELSFVNIRGGETLFSAGDPGDALYIVVFGRLRALLCDARHGDQVLGEIGRGESVGEMALLTGDPRSATVRAVRDTKLIKLTKAAFDRLVEREPRVMLEMVRLIVARYRRVIHPADQRQPVTIAVVPCSADIPVQEFSAGLVRALSSSHTVFSVDSNFEAPDLAGVLHEQELQHDYVVYRADPTATPWTQLCLRQADIVLLVGDVRADSLIAPDLVALIRSEEATSARKEFVFLYDSSEGMPRNSARWLDRIPVSGHHHLDSHQAQDYERLARLLTGRAIGLVLGGGGARGLAHIGVIRALEEAGIPVDFVGGTSIGAIIGGQLASGWDSARIQAESRRVLVEQGSLNDYTLPIIALLRGRRYHAMLDELFSDRRIEDLPLGYFCVSANLSQSTCMIHRSGMLKKWVAASMAVPGVGPPIFDGRDVLVDGGVVNNLPVSIMRGIGRGPVFASNVSPRVTMQLDRDYTDFPSPWRVLLSRMNPFMTPMQVPSITSVLMRTVSLRQQAAAGERHDTADLMFEPPVGDYKLLDWKAFDKIVDAGYRSAATAIERWQAQPAGATPRR